MQRDLIFRFWSPVTRTWSPPANLAAVAFQGQALYKYLVPPTLIPVQYTGRVDKKGIMVFEGDIVSGKGFKGESVVAPVIWYHSGWYVGHANEQRRNITSFDAVTDMLVIGNIFEV